MSEITHKYTEAPWYKNPNAQNQYDKFIKSWSITDLDPFHVVPSAKAIEDRETRTPLTFDIETTGRTPQDPVILTAYDESSETVITAWNGSIDREDTVQRIRDAFTSRDLPVSDVQVVPLNPNVFENLVLGLAQEDGVVLTGHNVAFDLWMMGTANDSIFETNIPPVDTETATEYQGTRLLTRRAGQFGRIYGFRDHNGKPIDGFDVADTMVAAKAMWLDSSLGDLCESLGIEPPPEFEDYGEVTPEYVEYNAHDVAATHAAYYKLRDRLWSNFSAYKSPEDVYSTASIFKDVLARMNYDRVGYPKDTLDIVSPSYFGGRTEAIRTGELLEGMTLVDFVSQYPTVSALSDVWRFAQAEYVQHREVDPDELPQITSVEDLNDPEVWRDCADYYVRLDSGGSTLPVRTQLPGTDTTRVYNAQVTHDGVTTIHHFYDYLGSLLTSDKPPTIREAWKVYTVGEQRLRPTAIGDTSIGMYDNPMKRAIEERKAITADSGKDEQTQALKITANSGYGTQAERIVAENFPDPKYKKHDVAGKYYNPHIASTITAGGRLMISMGEAAAEKEGGRMWYCDTDSLLVEDEIATDVQEYFDQLNPYDGVAGDLEVLEIEDTEVNDEEIECVGMDVYVVGEKKYAMLKDGELAKYTEHGLGHFEQLRSTEMVERFWRSLLYAEGIETSGEQLSVDELETAVTMQMSASTRIMRETVTKLFGEDLNYGDWLKMSIPSTDIEARFLGIDLEDQVVKVKDGKATPVDSVSSEGQKTIGMVRDEWRRSSEFDNYLPSVSVVDTEVVTKESTSVEIDMMKQLEKSLEAIDFSVFFS